MGGVSVDYTFSELFEDADGELQSRAQPIFTISTIQVFQKLVQVWGIRQNKGWCSWKQGETFPAIMWTANMVYTVSFTHTVVYTLYSIYGLCICLNFTNWSQYLCTCVNGLHWIRCINSIQYMHSITVYCVHSIECLLSMHCILFIPCILSTKDGPVPPCPASWVTIRLRRINIWQNPGTLNIPNIWQIPGILNIPNIRHYPGGRKIMIYSRSGWLLLG